jgi:hypothetical protein
MMTVKSLTSHDTSEARTLITEAVRAFNELKKGNPKSSIYLIAYGNADHNLDSSEPVGEVPATRNRLQVVRKTILDMGVDPGRVVIVGVVMPDKAKAGQIDVVVTPVPLPVVVWTENGMQTGQGQSGPDISGSVGADLIKGDVATEVEVEFSSGKKFKANLTFQITPDGVKEVSGKLKLLNIDIARSTALGTLTKVKLTVKSGFQHDFEKDKIKAKLEVELSGQLKIPGVGSATIKASLLVDHGGKVAPALGVEAPLPGPFR